MNKVFTIIIKAKLTITQFLCSVIILSVTRLWPTHTHTQPPTHTHIHTLEGSGAFASQTPPLRLLLSPKGTQATRSQCPVPLAKVQCFSEAEGRESQGAHLPPGHLGVQAPGPVLPGPCRPEWVLRCPQAGLAALE